MQTELMIAIQRNDIKTIYKIINDESILFKIVPECKELYINVRNREHRPALYFAIKYKMTGVALKLLNTGKCDLSIIMCNYQSMLMAAFQYSLPDVVDKILDFDCELNSVSQYSDSAIRAAVYSHKDIALKMINKGCTLWWDNSNYRSVILYALEHGKLTPIVDTIIEKYKDVDVDKHKRRDLFHMNPVYKETQKLIDSGMYDLDLQDENGNTVLHNYLKNYGLSTIKKLVENKCNVNIQNNNGITALMHSIMTDNMAATCYLIRVASCDIYKIANNGDTAVSLALEIEYNNSYHMYILLDKLFQDKSSELLNEKVIKFLVDKKLLHKLKIFYQDEIVKIIDDKDNSLSISFLKMFDINVIKEICNYMY